MEGQRVGVPILVLRDDDDVFEIITLRKPAQEPGSGVVECHHVVVTVEVFAPTRIEVEAPIGPVGIDVRDLLVSVFSLDNELLTLRRDIDQGSSIDLPQPESGHRQFRCAAQRCHCCLKWVIHDRSTVDDRRDGVERGRSGLLRNSRRGCRRIDLHHWIGSERGVIRLRHEHAVSGRAGDRVPGEDRPLALSRVNGDLRRRGRGHARCPQADVSGNRLAGDENLQERVLQTGLHRLPRHEPEGQCDRRSGCQLRDPLFGLLLRLQQRRRGVGPRRAQGDVVQRHVGHVRQFDLDRVRQVLVRRVIGRDVEAHGVRAPDVHGFVRLGDKRHGCPQGLQQGGVDGGQVVVALLVSADDPRELLCLLAGDVGEVDDPGLRGGGGSQRYTRRQIELCLTFAQGELGFGQIDDHQFHAEELLEPTGRASHEDCHRGLPVHHTHRRAVAVPVGVTPVVPRSTGTTRTAGLVAGDRRRHAGQCATPDGDEVPDEILVLRIVQVDPQVRRHLLQLVAEQAFMGHRGLRNVSGGQLDQHVAFATSHDSRCGLGQETRCIGVDGPVTIRHSGERAVADGTGDAGVTLSQIVDEGNGRTWQAVVRTFDGDRQPGPGARLDDSDGSVISVRFLPVPHRESHGVVPRFGVGVALIHTSTSAAVTEVPVERQRHVRGLARGSVEVNGLTHGDDTIVPGAGLQRRRAADGDCRCLRHPLLAVIDLELDRERPDPTIGVGQLHLAIGDAIAPLTRAVPIVDRVTQPVPIGIGDVEGGSHGQRGYALVRGDAQVRGRWPVDPWPDRHLLRPRPGTVFIKDGGTGCVCAGIRVLVLQRDRLTRGQGLLGSRGPVSPVDAYVHGSDAVVGHHLQFDGQRRFSLRRSQRGIDGDGRVDDIYSHRAEFEDVQPVGKIAPVHAATECGHSQR